MPWPVTAATSCGVQPSSERPTCAAAAQVAGLQVIEPGLGPYAIEVCAPEGFGERSSVRPGDDGGPFGDDVQLLVAAFVVEHDKLVVSDRMPAISSARELTQASCPLASNGRAGRSGRILSRRALSGLPPPNRL